MDVLLIRCNDKHNINTREAENVVGNIGIWPPLGLIYLGTILKENNYKVKILDLLSNNLNYEKVKEEINRINPQIVGITVTTPEIQEALNIAKIAKKCGKITIFGGTHLSLYPKETLSFDFVDYGIIGDGEFSLLKLINYIKKCKGDLKKINGLVYKKGKKIICNKAAIIEDINNIPIPDWSLVSLKNYSRADALFPMATMISAKGCPYKCGFCFRSKEQKLVRIRSPEKIVDEMEILVNKFGVKEIIFCNDNITINREQMIKVCQEIIKRKIKVKWQGATRINLIDEELLKLMKKAGCKQLKYGVESGDQNILNIMNKNTKISEIINAFKLTKKAGIKIGAYFILGYIKENEETIRSTINFAKELNPDYIMFYPAIPLPKTSFHDLAVKDKLIDKNYWREYSLNLRKDKLPYVFKDAEKWVEIAFRKFYWRPNYIFNRLFDPLSWRVLMKNPGLLLSLLKTKIK